MIEVLSDIGFIYLVCSVLFRLVDILNHHLDA